MKTLYTTPILGADLSVNTEIKEKQIAEKLVSRLYETHKANIQTFRDHFKELNQLIENIKGFPQNYKDYDEYNDYDPAEIGEFLKEYNRRYDKYMARLDELGLGNWLWALFSRKESNLRLFMPTHPDNFSLSASRGTDLDLAALGDKIPSKPAKLVDLFAGLQETARDFNMTNIRLNTLLLGLLPDYVLLVESMQGLKNASKKANNILSHLVTLSRTVNNIDNYSDTRFFETPRSLSGIEISDYLKQRKALKNLDGLLVEEACPTEHEFNQHYSSIKNLLHVYQYDLNLPVGSISQSVCEETRTLLSNYNISVSTKFAIRDFLEKLEASLEELKEANDYQQRVSKYRSILSRFNDFKVPFLGDQGTKLNLLLPELNIQNFLYFKMLGYDNYNKLLTYFDTMDINIHTFWDNVTDGVKSLLWEEETQVELFRYLKKLGKKSPNKISFYMGYFGYKKAREARNTMELDAYIATILEARKGFSSGSTGPNNLLLSNNTGTDLIFFTKEENEISTIGSRTGCCFTPNGLAKSLLRIARNSPISGILEGRHGGRKGSDWFSFVWELVEYNPTTKTFETALILDNIESMNSIGLGDWKDIYRWLLETPYNKIYLGTMRNDLTHDAFNDNASLTDIKDYRILPSTKKNRSRHIIYYDSDFQSYHYDDSKQVYTVLDRTARAPRSIQAIRINTEGDFHRLLYMEELVWGEQSDYATLKKLKFRQSPSYLVRDSLGNLYGYMITRLYTYDTTTSSIDYDDSLRIKPSEPLDHDKELVLYLDDVFITKNTNSLQALNFIVEDIIKYAKVNDIKYVSAHFNQFSSKFKKRIEAAGFTILNDTRFRDSGTMPAILPETSQLLVSKEGKRIKVVPHNMDKPHKILFPAEPEEDNEGVEIES